MTDGSGVAVAEGTEQAIPDGVEDGDTVRVGVARRRAIAQSAFGAFPGRTGAGADRTVVTGRDLGGSASSIRGVLVRRPEG